MPPSSTTKPRVFVAEDDPATLELITTRLDLAGYEVFVARDGWAAVAGIRAITPVAIILDVNMPKLDGFGVLRALRRHPAVAALPVMMLTSRNAPDDVLQAMTLGARDYLTKPFDDAVFLNRVARLMQPKRPLEPSTSVAI